MTIEGDRRVFDWDHLTLTTRSRGDRARSAPSGPSSVRFYVLDFRSLRMFCRNRTKRRLPIQMPPPGGHLPERPTSRPLSHPRGTLDLVGHDGGHRHVQSTGTHESLHEPPRLIGGAALQGKGDLCHVLIQAVRLVEQAAIGRAQVMKMQRARTVLRRTLDHDASAPACRRCRPRSSRWC